MENWLEIVKNTLITLGGKARYKDIYAEIEKNHTVPLPDQTVKINQQEIKDEPTDEKEAISREQTKPKSHQEINYDKVKLLHARKMKVSKIAREVGISRGIVYKYINADVFPQKKPKRCLLTPYLPFLNKKIKAGSKKVELWQEVVKLGYKGGYRGFCHIMCRYYPEGKEGKSITCPKPDYLKQYSPRRLSYLLSKKEDKQTDVDRQFFQDLYEFDLPIKQATQLMLEFCEMIRKKKGKQFDDWLTRAENSEMKQVVNFAAGIRNDYQAVKNACTIEWEQWPSRRTSEPTQGSNGRCMGEQASSCSASAWSMHLGPAKLSVTKSASEPLN